MINQILKDIDNEECYYIGNNGCLYQDLEKNELLAIKEEIKKLNDIRWETINFCNRYLSLNLDAFNANELLKKIVKIQKRN